MREWDLIGEECGGWRQMLSLDTSLVDVDEEPAEQSAGAGQFVSHSMAKV